MRAIWHNTILKPLIKTHHTTPVLLILMQCFCEFGCSDCVVSSSSYPGLPAYEFNYQAVCLFLLIHLYHVNITQHRTIFQL
jgi:hypothetical protein